MNIVFQVKSHNVFDVLMDSKNVGKIHKTETMSLFFPLDKPPVMLSGNFLEAQRQIVNVVKGRIG